jgi:branched-chain amino acid transport system substrate-binding protein
MLRTARTASQRLAPVVGLIALSVTLAACGSSSSGGSPPSSAPASAPASTSASPATSTSAAASGFTVNTSSCEDPAAATKKVTGTWTVGYSLPLSGPVAGVVVFSLDGFKARLAAANAAGGIDGVQIKLKELDDAFTPDRTKSNVTQFIESDHVNSLDTFGDGDVGAAASLQNAACVPMLYPSSEDPTYRNISKYPWTVTFLPPSNLEDKYDVGLVKSRFPAGATVGIMENPDSAGVDEYDAFKAAAAGSNVKIVAVANSTDPNSAATQIAQKKPDVVYVAGITTDCGPDVEALGRIGFTPKLEINPSNCADDTAYEAAGAAANGNVIPAFLRDPSNPKLANDPGVKEYLSEVKTKDALNTITVSGWEEADLLVNTLKQAAASPAGLSEAGVIEAARDQDYASPMLPVGAKWLSTPTLLTGVNAFQTTEWNAAKKVFVAVGKPISIG